MRHQAIGTRRQLLLLVLLFIVVVLVLPTANRLQPVFAAATPSPSTDPTDAQNLQSLQAGIASKAATIKNQVIAEIQNKAYIGTISNLDTKNNMITLNSLKGDRQVVVDDYTTYQDDTVTKQSKTFGIASLKQTDTLAALGDVDDKNILHAKKIVRVAALTPNTDTAIWGKISSVFPSSIDITDKTNQKISLTLSGNTLVRFNDNEDATLTDIKPNSLLISIGTPQVKQASKSFFIYLFDSVMRSPSASPSAKLATPSAKLKSK